jgi:hypothetical protein
VDVDPEPDRGGFELGWSLFGVRFRIFPSFFLFSGLLAAVLIWVVFPKLPPEKFIIGVVVDVACIFVALAFTGFIQGLVYRSYGIRSSVVIQEFGSGVHPEAMPPLRLQRIVVALASPASSFLLFALVYYSNQEWHWSRTSLYAEFAYLILYIITLVWGILGFLPMFPYPGGKVMLELLSFVTPRYGIQLTLGLSILIGLAVLADTAILLIKGRSYIPWMNTLHPYIRIFIAIFFAINTAQNWHLLQRSRVTVRQAEEYDDRSEWEKK